VAGRSRSLFRLIYPEFSVNEENDVSPSSCCVSLHRLLGLSMSRFPDG
jgi:hypothetical protein